MRVDWTASGACTSGSTAPPRGATRQASGGAATTSTRGEKSHGRDADARRLVHVDDVDANAWADLARCRGVVPRHVVRHDGGDDAAVLGPDAVALPPGRRQ